MLPFLTPTKHKLLLEELQVCAQKIADKVDRLHQPGRGSIPPRSRSRCMESVLDFFQQTRILGQSEDVVDSLTLTPIHDRVPAESSKPSGFERRCPPNPA